VRLLRAKARFQAALHRQDLAITEPVTGGGSRQLIPRLVLDFPLRRDNSVVFVAAKAIFPSSSLRRHDDPVGTVVDVTEHPITGTFREWHDLENRFAAMRNDQPLPALLDLLEILERVRFESGFGNRVFCHQSHDYGQDHQAVLISRLGQAQTGHRCRKLCRPGCPVNAFI